MGMQLTDVVKNLLIINVLFFVGALTIFGEQGQQILALFYFEGPFFRPFQIATHFFMHAGIGHIFFNMLALVFLGPALENYLGEKKFLIYYFTTAAGAAILHSLVQYFEYNYLGNQQILGASAWGASGAVYAVMVGYALKFPHQKLGLLFLPIQIPAYIFVLILITWDILAGWGSFGTGIAHFAHLGGALIGYFMIDYWEKHSNDNRWDR